MIAIEIPKEKLRDFCRKWKVTEFSLFGSVVREGAQIRLEWTGGAPPFQVQEAPTPTGPWQNLGGADSNTLARVRGSVVADINTPAA